MEIYKELNLNGNPQSVPNGSLVFAKNIKLSLDGTYITNDDGFTVGFSTTEPQPSDLKVPISNGEFVSSINSGENIVGFINCPNEIVLITSTNNNNDNDNKDNIYRAIELNTKETFALYKIPTAWKYSGGKIIGTYTYNVYGHLIIAIAESEANEDKELVTIDLNESTSEDSSNKYSAAPAIPICNLYFINKVKGNPIPHGIYHFFIRYEISDKLYTNWFPIGVPQYALSLDYKNIVNHWYNNNNNNTRVSSLIDTGKDSYYNFNYSIQFNNTYNYKGYQIGYILQTEDAAVARIWKNFGFDGAVATDKSFIFNGGYIEQLSIEEFTDNVINLYNVKALTKYDSKLYLANFKETDYNIINDDIQDCVDSISAYQVKKKIDIAAVDEQSKLVDTWTYSIGGTMVSKQVPQGTTEIPLNDFPDLITLMDAKIEYSREAEAAHIRFDGKTNKGRENDTDEYYTLELSESGIILTPNEEPYPNYANPGTDYDDNPMKFKTYHDDNGHSLVWNYVRYRNELGDIVVFRYGTIEHIEIERKTTVVNYNSYNNDAVIRTLMPNEVYAFYVHFVREDGSFTNGYPLTNKISYLDYTYHITDFTEEALSWLGLKDLSTISQLSDKYLYELISNQFDGDANFIPFITDDGRCLFKTGNGFITKNGTTSFAKIGVIFKDIRIPTGFVGCFFSYEKVESLVSHQAVIIDKTEHSGSVLAKSGDVEYFNSPFSGSLFVPHHKVNKTTGAITPIGDNDIKYAYINNMVPILSNAQTTFLGSNINRFGTHGGIIMNMTTDGSTDYIPIEDEHTADKYVVGNVISFNRSIYNSESKELIPFGPIITFGDYGESYDDASSAMDNNMNYPSFIVQDKLFIYDEPIFIDEQLKVHTIGANNVINPDEYYTKNQYVNMRNIWKYSNYNLLGLSFKKEPEDVAGVINNNSNILGTIVRPINASDLFKLESCYIPQIYKAFTNYNKYIQSQTVFANVIRASYPIRNESNVNSWRMINNSAHYIINSANGEIVNIFAAGTSFYIHTRNNLLVTSADAKLSANNTQISINNNDIFDIAPKEVFTSDLGYGGIKYQECQLFSQLGYIWYDTDRHKLFRFDNSQLVDLGNGIDNILKKYNFEKCYINIDDKSNRLYFCFDTDKEDENENNTKYLTLSYSTITNKWLSINDFYFTKSIHTINKSVFSDSNNFFIYNTNNDSGIIYYGLNYINSDFPSYYKDIPDSTHSIMGCVFDVIFNTKYTVPKVLDSISWVFDIIKPLNLDKSKISQIKVENEILDKNLDLEGVTVLIYTDAVDTGQIELYHNTFNDVTNLNSYKYPYYNKGVWNLNHFRNNITVVLSETELSNLATQLDISVDELKKRYYPIINKDNVTVYRKRSDDLSLIYGKYIVVRFIFIKNKDIRFDNLEFNLQKY